MDSGEGTGHDNNGEADGRASSESTDGEAGRSGATDGDDQHKLVRRTATDIEISISRFAPGEAQDRPWLDIKVREERARFAQTLFAVETGQDRDHLTRPPTVLWRLNETRVLAQLGRSVSGANTPASVARPDTDTGPWYIPHETAKVLQCGADGYGAAHARAFPPETGPAVDYGALTVVQCRVVQEQNGTVRVLPNRVRRLIRNMGEFTLARFMDRIEAEVGLRLVHFNLVRTVAAGGGPATAVARLGYALDEGGRYFACFVWPVCEGDAAEWWGESRIVVINSAPPPLRLVYYTCRCE